MRLNMFRTNFKPYEDFMSNQLILTKELNEAMHPVAKTVYNSTSLPSMVTTSVMCWSNNDEQFVIELNRNTNIITGHYYDWNEETQQWDDANDRPMTETELLEAIKRHKLLMVR